MNELSRIFKALSDPLRLRILRVLLRDGREAYGEELANALGIPAYCLSRHLKVLKTTGLIRERRVGRWVYYSVANRNGQVLAALRRLISQANIPQSDKSQWVTRPSTPHRGSRKALRKHEEFNWNQGPAIPGIL